MHGDSVLLHFLRQLGGGLLQLVLHLDLGNVRIGSCLEGDGHMRAAVAVRLGAHVHVAVKSGHVLLDNLGDGV